MNESGYKLTSGAYGDGALPDGRRLALMDRHECAEALDIASRVAASDWGRRRARWRVLLVSDEHGRLGAPIARKRKQ